MFYLVHVWGDGEFLFLISKFNFQRKKKDFQTQEKRFWNLFLVLKNTFSIHDHLIIVILVIVITTVTAIVTNGHHYHYHH